MSAISYAINPNNTNPMMYIPKPSYMGQYTDLEKKKFDESRNSYQALYELGRFLVQYMTSMTNMVANYLNMLGNALYGNKGNNNQMIYGAMPQAPQTGYTALEKSVIENNTKGETSGSSRPSKSSK